MSKTNVKEREAFWQRHRAGESYQTIAASVRVSKACVGYWCRRQSKGGSPQSHYKHNPTGVLSHFAPLVRYVLLRLRLAHPRWGPSRLLYHMGKRASLQGMVLPSETQIGRYLHQWPRFHRQRRYQPSQDRRPLAAVRVHQRWQVDFKLGIALAEGRQVNLHTVRDEVGALCIAARLTDAGPVGQRARRVKVRELQQTLRIGFTRWGTLPEEVQSDHEAVFVGLAEEPFPSLFTLWLVGLGIKHLTIRTGHSTDNAEVERTHRTIHDYAVIGNQHLSRAALQQVLDTALNELATALPSQAHGCHGLPPIVAHPQLLQQPRPYQPHLEWALFQQQRVALYLAQFSWLRTVGKNGQICIGGHHQYYSVGRTYTGQHVLVTFDPNDRHFVFSLENQPSQEIARRPARNLSTEHIIGFHDSSLSLVPQQLPLPFLLEDG